MRERISRGKRTDNGEWIEGDLSRFTLGGLVCSFIMPIGNSFYRQTNESMLGGYPPDPEAVQLGPFYRVDPETVGDYTGLLDVTGRKIFEGDTLDDGKGDTATVFFTPPAFTAQTKSGEIFWLAEGKVNKTQLENTTVIGTIHD